MKASALLLPYLLAAATGSAETTPTRVRDGQQQQHHHPIVLLHTLAPVAPVAPEGPAAQLRAAAASTNTHHPSSTRGGVILRAPSAPSNDTAATAPATTVTRMNNITTAEAFFRVPSARVPAYGPTGGNEWLKFAASFWVGIDSSGSLAPEAGCGASLRAGVDTFWDRNVGGEQAPFAWYQFAPVQGSATGFFGFAVRPGDLVRFRLETPASASAASAASRASGASAASTGPGEYAVVAENFGPDAACDSVRSCRRLRPRVRAAWMVEDFPLAGLPHIPMPLANFTSVEFRGAEVGLADGTARNVQAVHGVKVVDMHMPEQGGRLTRCGVLPGMRVRCKRVVGEDDGVYLV
ncbi:hypothetical protein VTJ83DRAFT_5803 [Remersonia thermophila]|uniref:Uncharacterized protein n=1 Tax=Remersonia thermophila TaxID=72144 RepID=A0ABR4D9I0_9PEZI